MLERVRYEDLERGIGVEAFTDGYAYDDYDRVFLLSAAGRDSSVKAITSAVTTGLSVEVVRDPVLSLTRPYGEAYRLLQGRRGVLGAPDGCRRQQQRQPPSLREGGRAQEAACHCSLRPSWYSCRTGSMA